jgi:hypothetical protein
MTFLLPGFGVSFTPKLTPNNVVGLVIADELVSDTRLATVRDLELGASAQCAGRVERSLPVLAGI